MSTHKIEIIEIKDIFPHPNTEVEKMEMTKVYGWQCCLGKGQFKIGDKAIYIPPDYEVPLAHPLFSFLDKGKGKEYERISVRRFKGAYSQGLIVNVPDELQSLAIGSNVIEELGIKRYEPPLEISTYGNYVSAPSSTIAFKFDIENHQRHSDLFIDGEEVIVTEKIHGCNARFCYSKNKDGEYEQFCGSRVNWMGQDKKNVWWQAFDKYIQIGQWCKDNPDKILYGEIFGNVQKLKYGANKSDLFFAAFAVLDNLNWMDFDDIYEDIKSYNIDWTPVLYRGPYSEKKIKEYVDGQTLWPDANHIREGCVIVPVQERMDDNIGRVVLKLVSDAYLEKV